MGKAALGRLRPRQSYKEVAVSDVSGEAPPWPKGHKVGRRWGLALPSSGWSPVPPLRMAALRAHPSAGSREALGQWRPHCPHRPFTQASTPEGSQREQPTLRPLVRLSTRWQLTWGGMKTNEGQVTKAIGWRWVTARSLTDTPRRGGQRGEGEGTVSAVFSETCSRGVVSIIRASTQASLRSYPRPDPKGPFQ